jgi:hypothetical protein
MQPLIPPAHPCLPNLSQEEVLGLVNRPGGEELYANWLETRNKTLREAEEDPLYSGFELDCWQLNDQNLSDDDVEILAIFGWNRGAAKTWWAVKRLCEAAHAYPGFEGLLLAETDQSSIAIHQKMVWAFFDRYINKLQGKRTQKYKVNFTEANGFSQGVLLIPSGACWIKGNLVRYTGNSTIKFKSYKSDPGQFEGCEFGARRDVIGTTQAGNPILDLKERPDGTKIQNLAVVADEGLPLSWFRMLARRVRYRNAKLAWPYTPIKGMIPSIKTVVGSARYLKTSPVNVNGEFGDFKAQLKGLPLGHMPVLADCEWPRTRAVWHHWSRQSFNGYSEIVRKDCEGRIQEYVERFAFGFARDSVARQFGNFGAQNIVRADQLPEDGTNYQVNDPADQRPWFSIWVRVTEGYGGRPVYWIYRDWPDMQRYGEWAVETSRETSEDQKKGWDGDQGPAQANLNLGVIGYKREWNDLEKVLGGGVPERDPYRLRIQKKLPTGSLAREDIFERLADSRAFARPQLEEQGQISPLDLFAEEHKDDDNTVLEPIDFIPATGGRIDLELIKELLDYKVDKGSGKIVQPPRLYVSEDCRQVIWALENYTGRSGETGASKDVIDTLRYMAGGDLVHVTDRTFKIRSASEQDDNE